MDAAATARRAQANAPDGELNGVMMFFVMSAPSIDTM